MLTRKRKRLEASGVAWVAEVRTLVFCPIQQRFESGCFRPASEQNSWHSEPETLLATRPQHARLAKFTLPFQIILPKNASGSSRAKRPLQSSKLFHRQGFSPALPLNSGGREGFFHRLFVENRFQSVR